MGFSPVTAARRVLGVWRIRPSPVVSGPGSLVPFAPGPPEAGSQSRKPATAFRRVELPVRAVACLGRANAPQWRLSPSPRKPQGPAQLGNAIAARCLRAKPHDGERSHIHHVNGDRLDCRPRNLVLLTGRQHMALESDKRRRKAWREARQGVGKERRK